MLLLLRLGSHLVLMLDLFVFLGLGVFVLGMLRRRGVPAGLDTRDDLVPLRKVGISGGDLSEGSLVLHCDLPAVRRSLRWHGTGDEALVAVRTGDLLAGLLVEADLVELAGLTLIRSTK